MFGLAVVGGCFVGFAMGLTGGGGGVFAVPFLIYGLAAAPREAVGISLASVGGTALAGVLPRLWRGEVELRTGLLFAVAGMLGAPLGSWLSMLLPETVLLMMFGCLMLVVAWRMWAKTRRPELATGVCATEGEAAEDRSACQRDEDGTLRLTSRCARLLVLVGLLTGLLSGMFGVGGGFVIVPALVLFSGMQIHRAVGTSLLVIFLVSISGVASYLATGQALAVETTLQFLVGGLSGVWLGGLAAKRLKGATLQKIFATAVMLVAVFVIFKTMVL
ncbi:sulfite exporter TauE/SafE family protein [Lignipirellula cremea]|uniref:Probable membrane transporter protein n=1 Tax=Lignipirellula cremea TaxID=2528010 RepID=A0A518E4E1_9BACT|nr:sulfite exporter TauE/SafE family protein [Lignipirellula cremea]QDU98894.1 Sulfite exporter TauE/SafE [Lignipirellula cremea]QDU98951.1 Sulfite exporter TauE/SafE [Lignipirellula cremea]